MLGGHRLWHTPEVPEVTYRRDDRPVTVTGLDRGVDLLGGDDPAIGVQKRLRVELSEGRLRLEHEIVDTGSAPLTTSAWAITQVDPEGDAWVPLGADEPGSAFLPDRSIILWPYSSLSDPRLSLADELAIVRGVPGSAGRVKVGTARGQGWVAWRRGSLLFLIEAPLAPGRHGDMGASVQCYASGEFVELETLGPVEELPPGGATIHRSTWRLVDVDPDAPAAAVAAALGLPLRIAGT
jgi:hypothetical protein